MDIDETPFHHLHGLPIDQINALIDTDLTIRVGVPHKGGHLAIHAFENDYQTMVSANAFWNQNSQEFKWPEHSPLYETNFALDSGGYTALKLFQSKGKQSGIAGIFPWTLAQYVEFASLQSPSWWSQPDLCCEPEIATNQDEVDFRVNATATLLEATLRVVFQWQCQLANQGWSPRMIVNQINPPVPVIQGWGADDYLRSLNLLKQVWSRWEPWFAPPKLIGLGSVCRRDLHDPQHGLYAILSAIEPHLPEGSRLHLFGVKGAALSKISALDSIASTDSMAYDFGARVKAHRQGFSNTLLHRATEMTRWMEAAQQKLHDANGDQLRFRFG